MEDEGTCRGEEKEEERGGKWGRFASGGGWGRKDCAEDAAGGKHERAVDGERRKE